MEGAGEGKEGAGLPSPVTLEAQQEIVRSWGLVDSDNVSFTLLKHSENHTYLVQCGHAEKFILRLTPEHHRSRQAIEAELTFILLLHNAGIPRLNLCKPIPLQNQEQTQHMTTINPYNDGQVWFGALFEHAKGKSVIPDSIFLTDYNIIAAWGRTLGYFHQAISLTAIQHKDQWEAISPHFPTLSQTHGNAPDLNIIQARADAGHPSSSKLLKLWQDKLDPCFRSCGEKDPSVYSIIHGDLNPSNFFYDDETQDLWVFDFDQSQHNWFGFDIGTVLQMVQFFKDGASGQIIQGFDPDKFVDTFLGAYKETYPLMVDRGLMTPDKLEGWKLYREFYEVAVAGDVLYQEKPFDDSVLDICKKIVDRFNNKKEEN